MLMRFLLSLIMVLLTQLSLAGNASEIFLPVNKSPAMIAAEMARMSMPVQAATPVKLNVMELAALSLNNEANFTLPGNRGSYPIVYERTEVAPGNNITWIGYLKPFGKNFRAILTSGPGGAYGRILTPEGEFRLHSVAGEQWLIDTATAKMIPFYTVDDDAVAPPVDFSLPKKGEDLLVAAVVPTPQTTIDLMVLYTSGLVTRLGSVAAAESRIANLVAVANQAYIDSEVAVTLRLVHAEQVNYSDSASQSTALNALTYGTDPALAGVATMRNNYGADLVMLMRPYVQSMGSCGLAWLGGYNNTPMSGSASYGYSAVLDGNDGYYYCDDYTFVHELGHNMGSAHDRVTEGVPTGPSDGAYSYSFGYGVNNAFTTIMAYPSSYTSAPRIGRFSNPYISTCGGMACGVSESASNSANNVLSLNNTRQDVANFRASSATTSGWTQLPGSSPSRPSLALNGGTGKTQMVVRSVSDQLWGGNFNTSGTFEGWNLLPGASPSPAAQAWHSGVSKMFMVVRSVSDQLWLGAFDASGTFAGWSALPGASPSPVALAWHAGVNKLYMVARSSSDQLWLGTFAANGVFEGWNALPGASPSPVALAWNPMLNKMQMVARAANDQLYQGYFNSSGVFEGWTALPGASPSPVALAWHPTINKMYMVVRSATDLLWSGTFDSIGAFGGWTQLDGSSPTEPTMAAGQSVLQLVVRAANDQLWSMQMQ